MYNQPPQQPSAAARAPFPLTVEQLRMILGGLALLMAVLMFFGFFVASWMESEDAEDSEDKLTAWELFTGNNGDEDAKFGDEGDSVRGIERMLIFIPLLAIVLGLAGLLYGFGRMLNLPINLSPMQLAIGIAILAFILFIFPFLWQSMSNSDFVNQLTDDGASESEAEDLVEEFFADLYSTGQQIFFGLLALLAGLAAVALELPQVRQALGLTDQPMTGGYPPNYPPQYPPQQ